MLLEDLSEWSSLHGWMLMRKQLNKVGIRCFVLAKGREILSVKMVSKNESQNSIQTSIEIWILESKHA